MCRSIDTEGYVLDIRSFGAIARLSSQPVATRTVSDAIQRALLFPPVAKASKQSPCNGHCKPASDDDGNDKTGLAGDVDGGRREVDGVDVGERARVCDRKRFHLAGSWHAVSPSTSLVKAGLPPNRESSARLPRSGEGASRVAASTSDRERASSNHRDSRASAIALRHSTIHPHHPDRPNTHSQDG